MDRGNLRFVLLLSVYGLLSWAFSLRKFPSGVISKSRKVTVTSTLTTDIDIESSSIRKGSLTFYQEIRTVGKPPLLYLPGLDGQGVYSTESLKNLTKYFDVWRLSIDSNDRSRFIDIAIECRNFLKTFKEAPVLIGESFGGLLACYVSVISVKKPTQLVIVNPATSFDRTSWSSIGPLIANTGAAFPIVGAATLLVTAVEMEQFQRIGQPIMDRINSTETALLELNNMFALSKLITEKLPPETLNWRLSKWLGTGASLMSTKYSAITSPTLVIVGQNDRLLPSQSEGRRLQKRINSTTVEVLEFQDTGHAILDGSIDLASVLFNSRTFQPPQAPSVEVPYPSDEAITTLQNQVGPFIKSFSPVFLSRESGTPGQPSRVVRGIGAVPTGQAGRPVLLVGNHQLYGLDLSMLILEFLKERHTLVRGLAHPVIMGGSSNTGSLRVVLDRSGQVASPRFSAIPGVQFTNSGSSTNSNSGSNNNGPPQFVNRDEQGMREIFTRFGAVEVTPGNYYELLRRNETILLFPGGAKEAYHRKDEKNTLLWPEKTDFIRMAAAFDAIVVPFAAVGMADSVEMILDRDDLLQLPFVGKRVLEASQKVPQARPGGDDQFIAPITVPKLPSRNYFIFEEVRK